MIEENKDGTNRQDVMEARRKSIIFLDSLAYLLD
jgi:hypothetical protein